MSCGHGPIKTRDEMRHVTYMRHVTGCLRHSVAFALIRMAKIGRIRMEEEYTYVHVCTYIYTYTPYAISTSYVSHLNDSRHSYE